jgi:DNA-binding NarL/FixJ family response regulator
MSVIRILIVDDHQVVREGIQQMLKLESDIEVVGQADNFEDALQQAELHSPSVILMDIQMPGVNGIDATRRLKTKLPDCHIIMLTLYEEYIAEAMEAGADGYLLKDIKRDELVRAIQAVEQGRVPLSPLSKDVLGEIATAKKDAEELSLSERELSILQMIANGNNTEQIRAQLFLSDATVKRDVRAIFDKLNVRNRSEAVAEAYKRKLI